MFSRFRKVIVLALGAIAISVGPVVARELKFCADPNNMPFSNDRGEGFENRIATLIAADMGATATFVWTPEWRGFIRKGLGAGLCDVVPGVPVDFHRVRPTKPYYTASYAFVQPQGAAPITSFDDASLRNTRIGVQLVGNDGANTPPMTELARRGIISGIKGYMVIGDWSKPDPLLPVVAGVAHGDVDLSVVWGPVADYYAVRQTPALRVTHIDNIPDMRFSISMGVRKPDTALADEINRSLERRQADIRNILAEYHIQTSPMTKKSAAAE
ncbi:quinoprotein dehydrogenase-associated putative ABC transporter substrate-binding protein [Hyphomicrobium sp. 99]|uniref:quinoprotein dehydrogenase-associated putative ABC transporter substrate-binding protein n=1 Tax=Hyphomicrobium sp. 99 TaxID=1163419 RepID=UPI0005F7DFC2|nr:quinoprotein dehydrogenase-associated putative ABC transporter substrate-binding protein [Hyphomicrobium sp. 99]